MTTFKVLILKNIKGVFAKLNKKKNLNWVKNNQKIGLKIYQDKVIKI